MTEIVASQIQVTGPGLTEGTTGKKCMIYFTGASISELEKGLTHSVDGPRKSELLFDFEREDPEGPIEANYVPLLPGNYQITMSFNGSEIPGSPFKSQVTGPSISAEKLLSEVRVIGKCSSIGRALVINEFVVDCSHVKPVIGGLTIHVKGPIRSSAHLDIIDNRNGTYQVLYKPILPGIYNMDIKIAETHIPGSPFKIRVMDRSNSVF